jgi:hypothetical protein
MISLDSCAVEYSFARMFVCVIFLFLLSSLLMFFFLFAVAMDVEDNTMEPSVPLVQAAPPLVDWNSIQIQEENEEDGIIEICNEKQVYALLEVIREDEREEEMARAWSSRDGGINGSGLPINGSGLPNLEVIEGEAMLVDDYIQEETMMEYDKDNPTMALGIIYPCMEKF